MLHLGEAGPASSRTCGWSSSCAQRSLCSAPWTWSSRQRWHAPTDSRIEPRARVGSASRAPRAGAQTSHSAVARTAAGTAAVDPGRRPSRSAQQPRRPSVPVAPQILKVHQIHGDVLFLLFSISFSCSLLSDYPAPSSSGTSDSSDVAHGPNIKTRQKFLPAKGIPGRVLHLSEEK